MAHRRARLTLTGQIGNITGTSGDGMQIVIPMSGFGERFRRAGYETPKPLIVVEERPIIEHVVRMFPGESRFVFICNREHLEDPSYNMRQTLSRVAPQGRIVAIDPHRLGPVHAVMQAYDSIDDDEPTIVNYCDFCCHWDYGHFKGFVSDSECDGAIPSYRYFHPHTIWSRYYAYLREQDGWVQDIQEKVPFTETPNEEFASSGTYYFRSGLVMKRAFDETVRRELTVRDEYYVSMAYKPMLDAGQPVAVYGLSHFMQWGTPEDLRDYVYASNVFRRQIETPAAAASEQKAMGTLLLPMAGAGKRFADEGYADPKPLIPVSGMPMVIRATADLPSTDRQVFILRRDLPLLDRIQKALQAHYPDARLVMLDALTEGQASTCMAGLHQVEHGPMTIAACDTGLVYDPARYQTLLEDSDVDVLVWAATAYPGALRRPEMYGWIAEDSAGWVQDVSVKKPLGAPATDPIIVGAFTFKRVEDFKRAAKRMVDRDARVNGEFYVDMLINDAIALGLRCKVLDVDYYVSWGTPAELRTFEYWRDCFHAWDGHPYRLERDPTVSAEARAAIVERVSATKDPYRPLNPSNVA